MGSPYLWTPPFEAHRFPSPWNHSTMLAALLVTASLAQTTELFAPERALDGGIARPSAALTADLNGDGLADTIFVDTATSSVLWVPSRAGVGPGQGAPGGAFAEPALAARLFEDPIFTLLTSSSQLLATDVDGDGDLDLMAAGTALPGPLSRIVVGLNDGSGQMTAIEAPALLSGSATDLEALDLTGDGQLEFVLSIEDGGVGRALYFQFQAGALTSAAPLFVGARDLTELRKGDLDGDGDEDLVLVNARRPGTNDLDLLAVPNTGSLPLDPGTAVVLAGEVLDVEVGDINGDSTADLVFIEALFQPGIMTALGQGGFAFAPGVPLPTGANEAHREVLLVDQDGDGDLDLFTWQRPPAGATRYDFYSGGGNGDFTLQQAGVESAGNAVAFGAADMTGDGLADFVTVKGSFSQAAIVYVEAAAGQTPYGASQRLGETFGRQPIAPIDANGDHVPDLVVVAEGRGALAAGTLAVKLGLGDGRFGPALAVSEPGDRLRVPLVGDFDGDGRDDIAVPSAAGDAFLFLAGLGGGAFDAALATSISLTGTPAYADVADLDGDGLDDLIYTSSTGSRVYYSFGTSSGAFTGQSAIVGAFPQAVPPVAGDLDADGDLDLLYLLSDRIEVSINSGQRQFAPRTTLAPVAAVSPGERVVTADYDGDGVLDVVLPGRALYRGLGGGAFAAPAPFQGLFGQRGLMKPVDLDLDGDLDFFVRLDPAFSQSLYWRENLGGLSLGPLQQFPLDGAGSPFVFQGDVADFDGDGDLDVMAGSTLGLLHVYEGLTLGDVGTSYCGPATPNSTGLPGTLSVMGSTDLQIGRLSLRAGQLPPNAFGFFLASQTQADVTGVPGSVGRLCLGGAVGRFTGPGQVQSAGAAGQISLDLDLGAFPDPSLGLIPVQAGETWSFQAWHRDAVTGGGATANFTQAASASF